MKKPLLRDITAYTEHIVHGQPISLIARRQGRSEAEIRKGIAKAERWHAKQKSPLVSAQHRCASAAGASKNHIPPAAAALAVARLQHSWYESMGAWYRSQDPEETFKAATTGKSGQRAEHIKRMRVGDLRFLELARRLVREMVALETTGKIAHEEMDVSLLTPDEIRERVHSLVAEDRPQRPRRSHARTALRHPAGRLRQAHAAS